MLMRRDEINYLFQSFALIDTDTVDSNLMMSLHYTKLNKQAKEQRIHDLLVHFSVGDKYNAHVNEPSGGEIQRIAISRAMLKLGSFILADKPTVSLDMRMAEKVMDTLIAAAHESHKTLVSVTHDTGMAQKCDRVLYMQDGGLH